MGLGVGEVAGLFLQCVGDARLPPNRMGCTTQSIDLTNIDFETGVQMSYAPTSGNNASGTQGRANQRGVCCRAEMVVRASGQLYGVKSCRGEGP
jgi:hypothetical protein